MKPKKGDKKNYIGIEIECYGRRDKYSTLNKLFRKSGVSSNTQVVSDGSIRTPRSRYTYLQYNFRMNREVRRIGYNYDFNYRGYEIRVFAEEKDLKQVLTKVLNSINECGFKLNRSCGLHVHFDMRNKMHRVDSIYSNLQRCSGLLFKLQKKGRRRNTYCKKNKYTQLWQHMQMQNRKYTAINTATLREKSTIEVRLHHGSLDCTEILGWIRMLLTVINKKQPVSDNVETPKDFKKLVSKRKDLTKYITTRYDTYNKAA